ncbi:MAG: LCP family protein [Eubacterium sp.]|nr:LCP family protein [Eubacterium sp.]
MKIQRLVGCILAALQFIISALLVFFLIRTRVVPTKYIIMVGIILGLLPICFIAMQLKKIPGIIASALSVILIGIMCFGIVKVNQANKMMDSVTGNKTEVEVVNVYIGADDPVDSINKAAEKGYLFGTIDNINNEAVRETLREISSSSSGPIDTVKYPSIVQVADAFLKGEIQGLIVSTGDISILEGQEDYENFSKLLKIILEKKIEKEVEKDNTKRTDRTKADKERFCAYISGIDTYGDVTLKSRSDVNVIAVMNFQTHTILLLSTPRDYYVNLAFESEPLDKLTHAGNYGIEMSMATLENLYDTDLDYYIRVNFTGFVNIIDTLGGVDVESEYDFYSQLDDSGYHYNEGMNHLSGEAALYFARERYSFTEGDRQRGKNQMAVIKAVLNKLMSSELLKNYSDLMSQMKDCFQTNMTKDELGKLVQEQIDDGGNWNIVQYSVTGGDSMDYCYSVGGDAYVMVPYQDTVDYATELIKRVLNDEEISQSTIDNGAPQH